MRIVLFVFLVSAACTRQRSLPATSKHTVVGTLNDSTWFATGKALRLIKPGELPGTSKQVNLQILTDINYLGNTSATRSPVVNGCTSDCVPTQRLHLYNIPLRKGRYRLKRLDRNRTIDLERATYWLLIDGGGVVGQYQHAGRRPGWLRVTGYDPQSAIVEGTFSFDLNKTPNAPGTQPTRIPSVVRFRHVLFRVKVDDVRLKP